MLTLFALAFWKLLPGRILQSIAAIRASRLFSDVAKSVRRHMPIAVVNLVDSGFSLPITRRLRRELEQVTSDLEQMRKEKNYWWDGCVRLNSYNARLKQEILAATEDVQRLIDDGARRGQLKVSFGLVNPLVPESWADEGGKSHE